MEKEKIKKVTERKIPDYEKLATKIQKLGSLPHSSAPINNTRMMKMGTHKEVPQSTVGRMKLSFDSSGRFVNTNHLRNPEVQFKAPVSIS